MEKARSKSKTEDKHGLLNKFLTLAPIAPASSVGRNVRYMGSLLNYRLIDFLISVSLSPRQNSWSKYLRVALDAGMISLFQVFVFVIE